LGKEPKYSIVYDCDFDWKSFEKIPKRFRELIQRAIEHRLMNNPLSYGEALLGLWKGRRKLRVSIYRIIYEVEEKTVIVRIIKIGHRKKVYGN
jgi:mRNA interferase RelE/StbE